MRSSPAGGAAGRAAGRRHAPEIVAGARVHLHDVPLVEEERHLHHHARLQRGGLGAALGGVAAHAGVGAGDRQLHEVGHVHRDRRAVDVEDVHLDVLLEVVACVADLLGRERKLIVGLGVHEVVAIVLVEELHVLFLVFDQLHLLARAERVVDDLAQPHVLELGAHEGAALARLDVLEVHDGVRLAVEDDAQSLLELRGRHLHRTLSSPS